MSRYVDHVMGMPVSLAARQPCGPQWDRVMRDLAWVDQVFSTYRPDSFISRLGRGEITVAQCPPEVGQVLDIADIARSVSHGAFDVWTGGLDPSGVVKGWAVERASRHLEGLDFSLSAGGDMVCRSSADPWRIGIENPLDPTRLIATVPIHNGAVATSGTAHRGAHMWDGRGGAVEGVAAVTVLADSLTWADVDATAAFALGQRAAEWLRGRGRGGLVVWADGSTQVLQPCRPRVGAHLR